MISCIKNFPKITKFLLEHKANPDLKGENDVTAVYLAAKYGSAECIQLLLQYTREIDVK
jgi:ankyrin repeat protein